MCRSIRGSPAAPWNDWRSCQLLREQYDDILDPKVEGLVEDALVAAAETPAHLEKLRQLPAWQSEYGISTRCAG